jgi:hypothetical protein
MKNRNSWAGTVTELLKLISSPFSNNFPSSFDIPAPNKFKERVRRIAPALRSYGIHYEELPRTNKEKKIKFMRYQPVPVVSIGDA